MTSVRVARMAIEIKSKFPFCESRSSRNLQDLSSRVLTLYVFAAIFVDAQSRPCKSTPTYIDNIAIYLYGIPL